MSGLPAELHARTVELVQNQDLDAYIEAQLGRKWCLQQNGFIGQDTLSTFDVAHDEEATELVQRWLDSPQTASPGRFPDGPDSVGEPESYREGLTMNETVEIDTETILCELCNRGLLPQGSITVSVSW